MKVGDLVEYNDDRMKFPTANVPNLALVVGVEKDFYKKRHPSQNTPQMDRINIRWSNGYISYEPKAVLEIVVAA